MNYLGLICRQSGCPLFILTEVSAWTAGSGSQPQKSASGPPSLGLASMFDLHPHGGHHCRACSLLQGPRPFKQLALHQRSGRQVLSSSPWLTAHLHLLHQPLVPTSWPTETITYTLLASSTTNAEQQSVTRALGDATLPTAFRTPR